MFLRQSGFFVDGDCLALLMETIQATGQIDKGLLLWQDFKQRRIKMPQKAAMWILNCTLVLLSLFLAWAFLLTFVLRRSDLTQSKRFVDALSLAAEMGPEGAPDDAFFVSLVTARDLDGSMPFPHIVHTLSRMSARDTLAIVRPFVAAIHATHPEEAVELFDLTRVMLFASLLT